MQVVECMKNNCKKFSPTNIKKISNSISYLESIKKKIETNKKNPFIKNHKKIIKTLTYILNDFSKKYQKKYL